MVNALLFVGIISQGFLAALLIWCIWNEPKLVRFERAVYKSFMEEIGYPFIKSTNALIDRFNKNNKRRKIKFAKKLLKGTNREIVRIQDKNTATKNAVNS